MTEHRDVLVVGTGWVATHVHLPRLAADPRVARLRIFDQDPEAARRAAQLFGVDVERAAMEEAPADLVLLCSPPSTHADLARRALRPGRQVVVEKPLATTAADAVSLVQAALRLQTRLDVCYTARHHSDVYRLAAVVSSGELGEVLEVTARWWRRSGVPGTEGARSGGVIWDLGSHLADLVLGLVEAGCGVTPDATVLASTRTLNALDLSSRSWYADSGLTAAPVPAAFHACVLAPELPAMNIAAAWASGVDQDRVEVDVVGAHARAHLRTLFGFSPDRQRLAGPRLTILRAADGEHRVVPTEPVHPPVEYDRQTEAYLTPRTAEHAAGLWRAVDAVAVCEAAIASAQDRTAVRLVGAVGRTLRSAHT